MPDLREYIAPVRKAVADLYAGQTRDVPFHGLHHVSFVADKARSFADELGADAAVAEIAALVHDLNYLVAARGDASVGGRLRSQLLADAGIDRAAIALIEDVIVTSQTHMRDGNISREAMALSDADTLFKALPITPVLLAPLYMRETGRSVCELAQKIVGEQLPLREGGIYFYSDSAKKKYESWGDANLTLWSCIQESLGDPSVTELIGRVEKYTHIPLDVPAEP
jgi:uncharacterized protein